MTSKEWERVAYHEAGHALVTESVPTADPVHKISIIPRGIAALGYTLQLPTEDRYLFTRSELDRLGALTFESERHALFLPGGNELSRGKPYSEDTAREIDQEVKRIIDETANRVTTILTQGNGHLKAIAERLLEKEVLEGDELRQLLASGRVAEEAVSAATQTFCPPTWRGRLHFG